MSNEDILNILSRLHGLGCPSEILGCNPSQGIEDEKCATVEIGRNLLFQRSTDRNDLLSWIDSKIFDQNALNNIFNDHTSSSYSEQNNHVKKRLSYLMSRSDSLEFFDERSVQSKIDQLYTWKTLLRALDASDQIENSDIKFSEARRYVQFLEDNGSAKPAPSLDGSNTSLASKNAGNKISNSKFMLIPRDLEKVVTAGRKQNLNTAELKIIRDSVVSELQSWADRKEFSQNETSNCSQLHDKTDDLGQNASEKLSQTVKDMENACAKFSNIYLQDLQGWVDRTPKVETNSNLEQTTKVLCQKLSSISRRSKAISTIRSSVNSIASKSKELDSCLNNSNKY